MKSKYCSEMIDIGGVHICRLECTPCPMIYRNEECVKEKMKRFVEEFSKFVNKEKDGAE